MSLSLFDVIGPVMHGPSSNHTAGANRIGYIARQIIGAEPKHITLLFHPDFIQAYAGQRSHIALLAGCLGYREWDEESASALEICRRKGISWSIRAFAEKDRSRNVMCVEAETDEGLYRIDGDSVGGGNICINYINGAPVDYNGTKEICLIIGKDASILEQFPASKVKTAINIARITNDYFGNYLVQLDSKESLPASIHEIAETGIVHIVNIPPLSAFAEKEEVLEFSTFTELKVLAEQIGFPEAAIQYEMRRSHVSREKILNEAHFLLSVMRDCLDRAERSNTKLIAGLADAGDGHRLLERAHSGNTSIGTAFTMGLARAVLIAEMNASAGRTVAAPTSGSAGTFPAVLLTAGERYKKNDDQLINAILTAAAVGVVIGSKAAFSGTTGGCQSEIGIGAAMGAAAVVQMAGGSTDEIIQGAVITLKNLLGLTCDAPASPVEVPCIKRNAMGVSAAFFGAEMGLAGVKSAIKPDDVVDALVDTQNRLPTSLKACYIGGLASTNSGKQLNAKWKSKLEQLTINDRY